MIRLSFIIVVFLITGCQLVTEPIGEEEVTEEIVEETPKVLSKEEQAANQVAFEELISKAVDQRLIAPEDSFSMALIHRFFPNTSRLENQLVSIEPVAMRDSFWLLLYEFIGEEEEGGQMFLGSFQKTGYVIDLLEIQSISFDGHLSINLLDDDILEIEYRDFIIHSNFPNSLAQSNYKEPKVIPVRSKNNNKRINRSRNEQSVGSKYYRIQKDGDFIALATRNQDAIAKVFPQVSSRILSLEELEQLKPDELEMMRNELYNCHGFNNVDVLLENFFFEKGWFQPKIKINLEEMNEIEKINWQRMMKLK
ncbi:MAG: YARHG domain-containing protein [Saprospiraceae bacterium]